MDSVRIKDIKVGYIGLLIILGKVGGKLIPIILKFVKVLPKLLKGIISGKTVGAAASLGVYSLLFSWQMAVSLVLFIFIHEYGHLWAMKNCGIKTKGIYLIPGFGGAAVAAEGFKSSRNEAFIALMGPLVGLLFIGPMIVLYFFTGNPMFAAIASIMSLINLFNLFPINPLDGGRIVKSLVYSLRGSLGFFFTIFSLIFVWAASYYTGLTLLTWIAVIGLFEISQDYGIVLSRFIRTVVRCLSLFVLKPLIDNPTFPLIYIVVAVIIFACLFDAWWSAKREERTIFAYPLIVIQEALGGIVELFSIKPSHLKRIDNYQPMTRKQLVMYSGLYLVTAAGMLALVLYTASIPGSQFAREILM